MSRGRKPGFVMSDDHRVKIQNSNILNALIEHTLGEREMSATQVTTGLGLLRKVLPDLSASTVETTNEHIFVVRVPETIPTATEWKQRYSQKVLQ